jgi:septal ring factor EnvC (AmiA/AmiB activator)
VKAADWLQPALLAVLTGIVGFVAYIASTRANRETARTAGKSIDAEAFDRAKDIYLSALETARADTAATRAELATTRSELSSTRQDLQGARVDLQSTRTEMREAARSNERLTIEIAKLRAAINGANGN